MNNNSAPTTIATAMIIFPKRGGTYDIVLFDSNGDVIQEKQRTYACNTARWVAQHMIIDEHLLCNAIKHHRRGGECDGVIITSQGEVKPYRKPINDDRCTTNT
jgi:hypothetical protein